MGRKEDLGAEIANRIDRWNHLCEFGGKDPTYADGVNMNIVRNHILIAKQKCEKELDGDKRKENTGSLSKSSRLHLAGKKNRRDG